MNIEGLKGKSGWIAILAMVLVMTSFQAKLGLYHPERSQAHLVSQEFKPSECRLERAAPEPPVTVNAVIAAVAREEWRPGPDLLEYTAALPCPMLLPRSLWFRPPPARS